MGGALAGDGQPVELAAEAGGEVGDVERFLDLALPLGDGLAHLERQQQAEVDLLGGEFGAHVGDDLAPPGRR